MKEKVIKVCAGTMLISSMILTASLSVSAEDDETIDNEQDYINIEEDNQFNEFTSDDMRENENEDRLNDIERSEQAKEDIEHSNDYTDESDNEVLVPVPNNPDDETSEETPVEEEIEDEAPVEVPDEDASNESEIPENENDETNGSDNGSVSSPEYEETPEGTPGDSDGSNEGETSGNTGGSSDDQNHSNHPGSEGEEDTSQANEESSEEIQENDSEAHDNDTSENVNNEESTSEDIYQEDEITDPADINPIEETPDEEAANVTSSDEESSSPKTNYNSRVAGKKLYKYDYDMLDGVELRPGSSEDSLALLDQRVNQVMTAQIVGEEDLTDEERANLDEKVKNEETSSASGLQELPDTGDKQYNIMYGAILFIAGGLLFYLTKYSKEQK